MKKKKYWAMSISLAIILILLFVLLIPAFQNRSGNTYDALGELDRAVLKEANDYLASEQNGPVWEGYRLSEQPILAINKESRQAFLINPKEDVQSFFAKEIILPEDFSVKVYRISPTAPQMFRFLFPSNFNTIGKNYSVFGNDVYFTKYDAESNKGLHNSSHYITFLTHESFHYIMQKDWPEAGRFYTGDLTDKDLDLLSEEYAVLAKIYDALKQPDKSELSVLASEYVSAVEKRIKANPQYMQDELQAETCEGTATYVGMMASRTVGYDYQVMHIDASSAGKGIVELPFDAVVPMIRDGELSKDIITTDLIYHSGGLLCELIDQLQITDWQQKINSQTKAAPVTLYSVLAEYVHAR